MYTRKEPGIKLINKYSSTNEFLIFHLKVIHCAKSHLIERLPDFLGLSQFSALQDAIKETIQTIEVQLQNLEEMSVILNFEYDGESCNSLAPYAELCYELIHLALDDTELCDYSILYYMQNMAGIEKASFHSLLLATTKLSDQRLIKLIKDNFEAAKSERRLFENTLKNYVEYWPQ